MPKNIKRSTWNNSKKTTSMTHDEYFRENIDSFGHLWLEEFKKTFMKQIEITYSKEIVKEFVILDFTISGDSVILKWVRRWKNLTDEELEERYGK